MADICTVIAVHILMLPSNTDNAEKLKESVQMEKWLAGQQSCWKGPGDYSECRLNLYSAMHFQAYKQNLTLSYNRSSMTGRCREVITSLCSELVRLNIVCWVQFWIPRGLWERGDKAVILGEARDLCEEVKVLWGLLVQQCSV